MTALAFAFLIMWVVTAGYAFCVKYDAIQLKGAFDEQVKQLNSKPKEIEVVKKAVCECSHESSKHTEREGCREVLFKTVDGVETNKSFYCRCARYTGPLPLPAYYAPDLPDYDRPFNVAGILG